jgi:hypothetical protein
MPRSVPKTSFHVPVRFLSLAWGWAAKTTAAWWTYFLQKTEHTGRRSQRGQCEDKYEHHGGHTQHHGIYIQHQLPNQHQPCPCRLATYSSSSRGSGNGSSSILLHPNRELAVSWHLAFAAEGRTAVQCGCSRSRARLTGGKPCVLSPFCSAVTNHLGGDHLGQPPNAPWPASGAALRGGV